MSMNIEGDVVLSLHLMEHTMMCILLWYLHCIKKELCILRRTYCNSFTIKNYTLRIHLGF